MKPGFSRRFVPAATAAGMAFLAFGALAYAQAMEALSIVGAGGQRQSFQVEVARNDADRAQGLMYRRAMPENQGMLFDFGRVAPVSMWMQNTYLPLDMLFVRPDGTIARIAANTEPLSTRTIPSGEPILAVLELNAGTAARLGIKAGDKIEHGMFKH